MLVWLILFAVSISAPVSASEETVYMGFNYSLQFYDHDDLNETYNPNVAIVKMGGNFTENFGAEARFGIGLFSDSKVESGKTLDLNNSVLYGFYGKASLNLTSRAAVYGLVGVSSFDMTSQDKFDRDARYQVDTSGFSAGAGLESRIYKAWQLNAELMLYSLKSNEQLVAIELGGSYLF